MAPELFETEKNKSISSMAQDVWALGCVIMEIITNKKPFECLATDKEVVDYLTVGFSPWDIH